MIFRNNRGFWRRRGIISLEEESTPQRRPDRNRGPVDKARQDQAMQRLHDLNRELADYEAETRAPPRPPVRDTPSGEEEG